MDISVITRQTGYHFARRRMIPVLVLVLSLAAAASAQSSREQVEGVKNFGRVTDRFFRGGQITPAGIEHLAALGVRTIVDLRDKESPGEEETAQRYKIKYFKFPMNGSETPDDKSVNEILSIIQSAKDPVYVHCSAGKHRAGTISALYRLRVQGWSKEKAWAEQQSYGFGPAQGHPELYAYVYGEESQLASHHFVEVAARSKTIDDEEKSSESRKKDKSSAKSKKKSDKDDADNDEDDDKDKSSSKSKKKADKDDADDDREDSHKSSKHKHKSDKEKGASDSEVAKADVKAAAGSEAKSEEVERPEPAKKASSGAAAASLSADVDYIPLADAVKRAREEGGSGDVLKIDLEWDAARSLPTWDVTFSSGVEYEIDAIEGKLLGSKPKAPTKLATLLPLTLDGSKNRLLTFKEIIRNAETSRNQAVTEMELKQPKGRSEAMFEVVFADGTTQFFNAATGSPTNNL